jgi:hypothetical protein
MTKKFKFILLSIIEISTQLKKPNFHIDAGVNYYLAGHHAKCTIEWQYRPVWEYATNNYYFKNLGILKVQVFI